MGAAKRRAIARKTMAACLGCREARERVALTTILQAPVDEAAEAAAAHTCTKDPGPQPPVELASLSCIVTRRLRDVVQERFDRVPRELFPTMSSFLERLLVAGIAVFDQSIAQAEAQAKAQLSDVKGTPPADPAELIRRIEAAKEGAE